MNGRRKFLSGIAASSVAFAGNVTASSNDDKQLLHVNRPYSDSISTDHLNEIRAEAAQDASGVEKSQLDAEPNINIESNGEIVSVVVTTTDEGILQQKIGIAHRSRDVARAQLKGEEYAEQLKRNQKRKIKTSSVETTSDEWYTIEESTVSEYSNPEGDLDCLYKYSQNDDWFTYEERFATVPGVVAYEHEDSTYGAMGGEVNHYWNSNYGELRDWGPFGGTEGNVDQTITLDRDGPEYSYGYSTKETNVDDLTVPRNDSARFSVDYKESAKSTTSGFDPSSKGLNTDSAFSATYLNIVNKAEFKKLNCYTCDDTELEIRVSF